MLGVAIELLIRLFQFDVYVDDSDTSVSVSCFPDNMAELQFFLKQKEKRQWYNSI